MAFSHRAGREASRESREGRSRAVLPLEPLLWEVLREVPAAERQAASRPPVGTSPPVRHRLVTPHDPRQVTRAPVTAERP